MDVFCGSGVRARRHLDGAWKENATLGANVSRYPIFPELCNFACKKTGTILTLWCSTEALTAGKLSHSVDIQHASLGGLDLKHRLFLPFAIFI